VYPSRFNALRMPCIKRFNMTASRRSSTHASPRELIPPPSECPFILNTGLMVLHPLRNREFNEHIVRPIHNGSLPSYDGTDRVPQPSRDPPTLSLCPPPLKTPAVHEWSLAHPAIGIGAHRGHDQLAALQGALVGRALCCAPFAVQRGGTHGETLRGAVAGSIGYVACWYSESGRASYGTVWSAVAWELIQPKQYRVASWLRIARLGT